MSTLMRKVRLPGRLTVSAAFVAPISKGVEELMSLILKDYMKRFKVKVTRPGMHISICSYIPDDPLNLLSLNTATYGQTIFTEDVCAVQVRDPNLKSEDYMNAVTVHPYTFIFFLIILCHELVHVAQWVTGREDGIVVPQFNEKDDNESYFFNPTEVEADVLGNFYAHVLGHSLINKSK